MRHLHLPISMRARSNESQTFPGSKQRWYERKKPDGKGGGGVIPWSQFIHIIPSSQHSRACGLWEEDCKLGGRVINGIGIILTLFFDEDV